MEWSKIKTIILLMLVGVNLCLLALVGLRAGQGARYQDETRQAVLQVLERSGITFVPEQVPEDLALPLLQIARDRDSEEQAAARLLGTVSVSGDGEVRRQFTGPGGEAEFSINGAFSVRFSQDWYRQEEGESLVQASLICLEQLGIQARVEETASQGETSQLTCCQQWGEVPLFSCQIQLTWQGEQLTEVSGIRLVGEAASSQTAALLSTPTILLRFLAEVEDRGDICTRIEEMTPGYLSSGSSRAVQLTPVWRIVTDTGLYYADAQTGALTLAS